MADPKDARVAAIIQAAEDVFLRYGFKKTSMDDLARAAGLSRQGLYLYFRTKEDLFKETVTHVLGRMRAAHRQALARKDLEIEERLLEAFSAFIRFDSENVDELLEALADVVGPVLLELDADVRADLARALRAAGVPARWEEAGLSANDLADHLLAVSAGLKHKTKTLRDYRARMRVALRIVCRGGAR